MIHRLNLPGLLFLAALAGLWQLASWLHHTPTFPSFTTVVATLIGDRDALLGELGHTLLRAAAGFGLALGTMLPLGVLLGRVRALGDIVEPIIELVRPLPPIAMIPLWMIFFGIGDAAKIAVVAYGASFPILINTIDAVRALHPMLSHLARSLRLSRAERMRFIDLPAALPRIVAGVRLSIAISFVAGRRRRNVAID
ncbi:MAG: ABC transporter permease subunit [Stellaceae bacterium]